MDTDLFRLAGKTALVVGGGQGIGEATALLLARVGCAVAVVDLEAERAEKVAAAVRALGRPAAAIVADVLDDAAPERIVAETLEALGGLDVMVCIVGAAGFGGVLEMTPKTWDAEHARNLRYFFFMCQAAARSFVRRKTAGVIVGLGTAGAVGFSSMPFAPAYGAAKAGLIHLVRSLAGELGEYGVRINAVAPGLTLTPRIAARPGAAAYGARAPLGHAAATQDIAKAVLFLASDLASHVTGVTLPVDGGSSASSDDLTGARAKSARNRRAMGLDV
ncbi:MAG: SDR family oxidoreductase [Caulobacteraceae bacterium]|nr:SDR family oxidoreductase [Caulobacteraceae bacterium]